MRRCEPLLTAARFDGEFGPECAKNGAGGVAHIFGTRLCFGPKLETSSSAVLEKDKGLDIRAIRTVFRCERNVCALVGGLEAKGLTVESVFGILGQSTPGFLTCSTQPPVRNFESLNTDHTFIGKYQYCKPSGIYIGLALSASLYKP